MGETRTVGVAHHGVAQGSALAGVLDHGGEADRLLDLGGQLATAAGHERVGAAGGGHGVGVAGLLGLWQGLEASVKKVPPPPICPSALTLTSAASSRLHVMSMGQVSGVDAKMRLISGRSADTYLRNRA
jgi:hypothetical protein